MVYNGEARGVCNDGFNDEAATVACNELYKSKEFISLLFYTKNNNNIKKELYGKPNFIKYSHGNKCVY